MSALLEEIANAHELNTDTIGKVRSILSGIFTYATGKGHFPAKNASENPASRALIPESATEPGQAKAATREEVKAILAALKEMPFERAAVAICAMLGCRPGEARGLRWEDWDRVKQQIKISPSVWHTIEGSTTTQQSVRFVAVSVEMREVLLALWKEQDSPLGGCILAAPGGKPVILDNLAKRSIRPRLEALEQRGSGAGRKARANLAGLVFAAQIPRYSRSRRIESGNYFAGSRQFKGSRRPPLCETRGSVARRAKSGK